MQSFLSDLFGNALNITLPMVAMWCIGALLIYLAIKRDMEPTLLLPMGFARSWSTCPCPARSRRSPRAWRRSA